MTVVPFRPAPHPTAPGTRRVVETAAGRRIAVVEAGAGPDLLLIHGTLMTADDMRLGPLDLLAREFRCVAVDRPGHGWSDHRRGADASLWSQAATIHDAALALGLRRPVVCGHSFGGAAALAYGMAHPDAVAGIVALAPICFPEPRLEQALFGARAVPLAGGLLSRGLSVTLDPVLLPALWRAMFLPQAMPERMVAGFPFARAGHSEQLVGEAENAMSLWPDLVRSALGYAGFRVPVRIVCGGADIVVNPVTQGAMAAAMIPGAGFDLLPGIGHMLHHIRPDAVLAAVRAICAARISAGGAATKRPPVEPVEASAVSRP